MLMSSEQIPRGMSVIAVILVADSVCCFTVSVVDAALIGLDFTFLFDKPNNVLTGEDVIASGEGFVK
jgi:hypothetical protein